MQVIPGDPAQLILGTEADPEALQNLHEQLGLDKPVLLRYLGWLEGIARGDLGTSIRYQIPVAPLIAERLRVTFPLAGAALAIAWAVGVPLGIAGAMNRAGARGLGFAAFSHVAVSVPSFWVGILLMLFFSLRLGWLPPDGLVPWHESPGGFLKSLLMPAVSLSLFPAGVLVRMLRSSLSEVMTQDFILTARSKGLSGLQTVVRHGFRNAFAPVATLMGLQLAALLGGSIVVEQVFAIPGLGRLTLFAVFNRDLPLIQGITLVSAAVVLLANLVADLVQAWLDPRIGLTQM